MDEKITLLFGGDIQFDQIVRPPRRLFSVLEDTELGLIGRTLKDLSGKYFLFSTRYPRVPRLLGKITGGVFDKIHNKWIVDAYSSKHVFPVYYLLNREEHFALYRKLFQYKEEVTARSCHMSEFPAGERKMFPFKGIGPLVKEADLAFANLECPLSNNGRILGMFRADPVFAEGLKEAGFRIVSVANNHVFDAGEEGFEETLKHLDRMSIRYAGGGHNLAEARQPVVVEIKGCRIGFLAYSQFSDNGFAYDLASEDGAGILPFSMPVILEDIQNSRSAADVLVISLHWLSANTPFIHNKARDCAYKMIHAGADMIVGHHPHVYKAVEIYNGKPIFYSLGNLIFGHFQKHWGHNLTAKVMVHEKRIKEIELIPISGVGDQLFQPTPLIGKEAEKVLDHLAKISALFGTKIHRVGDRGRISLDGSL